MFEDDLYAFTEIEARRFPEYDQFYDGQAVVDFWENHEHRIRLVRDFGWSCFDVFEELCKDCPAKKWCKDQEED